MSSDGSASPPTAAQSSSPSTAPSPAPSAESSPSPLSPLISSTRQALVQGADLLLSGESQAVSYYNSSVASQANRRLRTVSSRLHELRHRHGGQLVAATALTVGLLSLTAGRLPAVRNALLAAVVSGWVVYPATVTGLMVAAAQQLQSAPSVDWTLKGEQTVRGQQQQQQQSPH